MRFFGHFRLALHLLIEIVNRFLLHQFLPIGAARIIAPAQWPTRCPRQYAALIQLVGGTEIDLALNILPYLIADHFIHTIQIGDIETIVIYTRTIDAQATTTSVGCPHGTIR